MCDFRLESRDRRQPRARALVALALVALAPAMAQARAFQVGCNEAELRQAMDAAGFNDEEDVLWLAPDCVYPLKGILVAYPDGGAPITIEGGGARVSGQGQRTILLVSPGAQVYVNDLTFTEGRAGPTASGDGGAIYTAGALTLTRSTVSLSVAYTGGGIYNAQNASLTLVQSTVNANTATTNGGGIRNLEGRLTVIDSTLTGNFAGGSDGLGGAIYNDDPSSSPARAVATLANCTISGNASRFGAGIFNDQGRVTVSHCTIAHNTAIGGGSGAGIYHRNYSGTGLFRIGHSIVSDSSGGTVECLRDPSNPSNLITPTGDNLIEDGSCQMPGVWSGDPKLGPLTGKPAHHPLLAGSPVVDLPTQTANCTGTDQRGALRPKDGNGDGLARCDLGAYEAP